MSTRIADLPDQSSGGQDAYSTKSLGTTQGIISLKDANRSIQLPPQSFGQQGVETTSYSPINVHPNPYGGGSNLGGNESEEKPMYRLQTHDIPSERDSYVRDTRVLANFIEGAGAGAGGLGAEEEGKGRPHRVEDYVQAFDDEERQKYVRFQDEKSDRAQTDVFLDKAQKPLFAMVLFLILQLPIWNNLLYKHVSPYLYVCNDEGQIVLGGMLFKTLFFGACLVAVDELVLTVSNF